MNRGGFPVHGTKRLYLVFAPMICLGAAPRGERGCGGAKAWLMSRWDNLTCQEHPSFLFKAGDEGGGDLERSPKVWEDGRSTGGSVLRPVPVTALRPEQHPPQKRGPRGDESGQVSSNEPNNATRSGPPVRAICL